MKAVTKDTFDEVVLQNPKPVLVDFWATWCGPCRAIAPILEELNREYDGIEIVQVNADEEPELTEAFQVTSIPLMKLFVNGSAVKTIIGAKPKGALIEALDGYLV